jgi:hypothetical protein
VLGIAPERLDRWLDGVAERHGRFSDVRVGDDGAVQVDCADTTTLTLSAPYGWTPGAAPLTALSAAVKVAHRTGVLLVRRGRWAVGLFDGTQLVVSKVDSRQVQGRTAAGGWSQQRFARRRGNQTDAVVTHAVDTAARLLVPHAASIEALVTGGDRALVAEVLAYPRLQALTELPRLAPVDVGEPTKAVLLETPAQFRAVRVHIVEPAERG